LIAAEEEEWERRRAEKNGGANGENGVHNFQEYREKAIAAGQY